MCLNFIILNVFFQISKIRKIFMQKQLMTIASYWSGISQKELTVTGFDITKTTSKQKQMSYQILLFMEIVTI